jgi:hypothetical protein
MAIYPEDYRKIVTKVTQKGSRIAVEARNLITDPGDFLVDASQQTVGGKSSIPLSQLVSF